MAYEGRFDHSDRVPLATDFHFCAVGCRHRHARQCNRLAKRRRETTTGDLPFANIGDADHLMSAQNPTLLKDQDDDAFINTLGGRWTGALPATFLFDGKGKLLDAWEHKATYVTLEDKIRPFLRQEGKETTR